MKIYWNSRPVQFLGVMLPTMDDEPDNATDFYFEGSGEDELLTDDVDEAANTVMIILYVTILLFALVGNSLVIHIIRTRDDIRKNSFNWLLVNTAAADLVDVVTACAFILPYFVCEDCWISGVVGKIFCKLIPFLLVVAICVSVWTLTIIAVDRYLAIVCIGRKPLSSKSKVRCIIIVWLSAGLLFSGQLYKFNTEEIEDGQTICYHEWNEDLDTSTLFYKAEMIVRVVVTYAIPLAIMAVLYSMIAYFLWSHKPPGNVNERAYVKKTKKRRVVIKMMIAVVTVFAFCWLPVHITHIMSEFYTDAYDAIPSIVQWLLIWLAHANAAIHPWLFISFSEKLRKEAKGMFRTLRKATQRKRRSMSLFNNENDSPRRSGDYTTKNGSTIAMNTL
ncbi:tachykinin-like peptides receptor 99D isoform X2 [Montipora foliosa]|uniref:tachykinin-like peptides receptor 99D isoform X2 n=1 Tax=Montipora foliosa TaxID=591990 RepID=UPI0035F191B4